MREDEAKQPDDPLGSQNTTQAFDELIDESRALIGDAVESMCCGDLEFSNRSFALAKLFATDALAILEAGKLYFGLNDSFRANAVNHLLSSIISLSDKTVIDAFLEDLKRRQKEVKEQFKFKKQGTFEHKDPALSTKATGRNVQWKFWRENPPKDKCVCLVSVFHFRKKGVKVSPTVRGFKKEYVRDNRDRPKNTLPHGGRDFNGYAVDTPFFHPTEMLKPIKCPCYLGQYRIDEKGKRADKGAHRAGFDAPFAKKSGMVEHFETAAICFEGDDIIVLNSMRWTYAGDVKIDKTAAGKIDRGDVSEAFKFALHDWIAKAKRTHKIDKIECCPK